MHPNPTTPPLTIHRDRLQLGGLSIRFVRTLRIPDDGRRYPLPPGLGTFPLRRVADHADRVPEAMRRAGGVLLPMYRREALWLSFGHAPHALKVGVGKVCALTGERWREGLADRPQNYLVTGRQPCLDGIATGRGTIRQFVAMPLGMGYTVEGQVSGEEKHGGLQLQAYPPKPGAIPPRPLRRCRAAGGPPAPCAPAAAGAMGLGAGGSMVQKIYRDPHGIGTWDTARRLRVFVHLVDAMRWRELTGEAPPPTPVTAKAYAEAGLPWFELEDEGAAAIGGSPALADVKSVKEMDEATFGQPLQDDAPVSPGAVVALPPGALPVSDGDWQ